MLNLVRLTDDHFAVLLGECENDSGLSLPEGGVDDVGMIRMLRRMVARLHAGGSDGHWLMVSDGEIVGLCGYKRPPDAAGMVEIGYGVAASRRNRGFATGAIGLVQRAARADPAVATLVAETAVENVASQRVLERNGFSRASVRDDPEDGALIVWRWPV
ncbi:MULTISPECIES: GNAT family N-acetyltransferase [Acidiphilium]|uniref:Acetyltransferase (GNAT) domain-containing protein n=1 Tax=Acidiphilium rubrum TaxID=526 RepID=A0A8G2FD53_ACIRU|nr:MULTISPECIES: GNAT family N-acetyltransferase [Acidiphilium]SIQ28438.1 Acetyltransferase (GNAT) domain-containing protein [Acidiphilium rubrum]